MDVDVSALPHERECCEAQCFGDHRLWWTSKAILAWWAEKLSETEGISESMWAKVALATPESRACPAPYVGDFDYVASMCDVFGSRFVGDVGKIWYRYVKHIIIPGI